MERSMFTDAELQLMTERCLKYQGTAKIELNRISCHPSAARQLDLKNVERLCEVLRKDGCHRLDVQNHITAVVTRRHLKRARRAARVTAEALLTNPPDKHPFLPFSSGEVQCLHGQHRLKAAEEVLAPSERWWAVDIYLDGWFSFSSVHSSMIPFILSDLRTDISHDLRNTLIDEYANEKSPSDGEVYRKIRQYQHEHNAPFQKRWWSRLSDNKAKRLRQLMSPDNVDICASFDALLPIPGLWSGMAIGSLHRVLALKCDEVSLSPLVSLTLSLLTLQEITHYLQHVKRFWSTLVDDDRDKMTKIDIHTVETLQLRAPTASPADAKAVKGLILGGEVFSHFGETERSDIWERIVTREACDGIIPSLHTFFRDVTYFEACAQGVKQIAVLSKGQPTVRAAMKHVFMHDPTREACLVQTSEASFRGQAGPSTDFFELAYRQFWLFVMRHYPEMAKKSTSKKVVAKASGKADEVVLYNMAALAQKIGFSSTRVTELLDCAPDRQIAREALLKARKPGSYRYENATFDSLVDRVVECFATAVAHEASPSSELVVSRKQPLQCRCGPPREHSQLADRRLLFLDRMHSKEASEEKTVSSFYVRQCVYFAFFGKHLALGVNQHHVATSPRSIRRGGPQSPLFVPIDNPPSTARYPNQPAAPGTSLRVDTPAARRQSRRERRRQRRETRGYLQGVGHYGNAEIMDPTTAANPAALTVADDDTNMGDAIPVAPGAEGIPMATSFSEIAIGGDDDVAMQDESHRNCSESSEMDPELLPNIEQKEQDEQIERMLALVTERESVPGDSDYESSADGSSEPGPLERHMDDLVETVPPQDNLQHSGPVQHPRDSSQSDGNAPVEEQETSFHEKPTREGSPKSDSLQLEKRPSTDRADHESLDRKVEEREAAEDAVQATLQELEREADTRALTANTMEGPEEQPVPSTDERSAQPEPEEQTLSPSVDVPAEAQVPVQQPPALDSTQVIQQGRVARDARAAKVITQIDFTSLAQQRTAGITPEGNSNQTEQPEPRTIRHDTTTSSRPQGFLEQDRDAETKKPRGFRGDSSEPAVSGPSVGEFSVPPLPAALHPHRILPPNAITITFKAFERGGWFVADQVQVDPNDPSEAQRIAYKYARKENQHARFYNKKLRLVSAAQCVRAAMDDGSNTVLMSLGQDLVVTRVKVAEVAEMLKDDAEKRATNDYDDEIL